MKVRIKKVESSGYVEVSAKYGSFKGRWCSNVQPLLEHEYYVELDIPKIYSLSDFEIKKSPITMIETIDGSIQITAPVKQYEDNVLFIQLGTALVMIETEADEQLNSLINKHVCFTTDEIGLYDIGI